jgi:hypothetical protein
MKQKLDKLIRGNYASRNTMETEIFPSLFGDSFSIIQYKIISNGERRKEKDMIFLT